MLEIFIAFGAGLISFLSPCVLPLIPGYISYISGSCLNELLEKKNINLIPIIFFTVGFSIVFIIFGAASTFLGQVFLQNSYELRIVAGLIIIIFSLHIIGLINIGFLNYEKRIQSTGNKGFFAPILIGMAFAFGWTPCIGRSHAFEFLFFGVSFTICVLWIFNSKIYACFKKFKTKNGFNK